MSTSEIYNYIEVNEQVSTGGMPTADQLRAAAEDGFRNVINLATTNPGHSLENEDGLAHSLELRYVHIPVPWDNPQESDFGAFEQAMLTLPPGRTLVHCAANYRASAFYALYAEKHLGWSSEEGEALRGKIWQGSDYPLWEALIARLRST